MLKIPHCGKPKNVTQTITEVQYSNQSFKDFKALSLSEDAKTLYMLDNLKKYLAEKGDFTPDDFELIESFATLKKLRKRQYLLQEGDVWKHIAFVNKGLLRSFFVDNKGDERIVQFAPENYWTGNRESLITGKPSKFNIEALEDCEIILFKENDFKFLEEKIESLAEMSRKVTNKNILVLENRIYSSITLSAEEKYTDFITQYPTIVNRVPQHMIASYIGISPETLSRLKRNAAKK